ncbi:MAG: NrtA/SsuA/CpmA family ABC transporter substrate-binding protein [Methanomassiliicoccus sp.]|nr:NrtA/SsuA/CpmA family ABC transporter substrate-binding protein [Methanomassiliicoccus sp.]
MKIGRKILAVVAAIIIVAAAVGAAILMSAPADDDVMELRLTYSNKIDYEPLIIAQEKGFFKDEGLNVTALIVSGGIQSAEALATGSADMGAMGDAPGVTLMAKNMGAKLIASYGSGEGQHRLVGWTDIATVTDLVGKKVGVQFGSSSQGALLRLLEANGLSADDITSVSLSPADMPNAVKTRQVDAIIGSEPWPTNVENANGADVHEITNSSGLGSTYPLVLMVTQKLIDERPEVITAALKAIDRAIAYMGTDYETSIALCAGKIGISVSDEKKCLDTVSYGLRLERTDIDSLRSVGEFLLSSGKISALPDIEAAIDRTYLDGVKA